jgi:hypothetical protein
VSEWWVSALELTGALCLLGSSLPLISVGAYLIFLWVRHESRIRKRARHDYRTARGTQHLRLLRTSLSTLQDSSRARQSRISNLERQLETLRRKRSADLETALSRYLVNERLTEVPGIGPRLSRRIIQYCFRNSLRDLRFASRVQGVGPSRQQAIMAWASAREREFPRLLAQDFPGKQYTLGKYSAQVKSLQDALESERRAFADEKLLHEEARAAVSRLRRVKSSHFRKALRRGDRESPIATWYFEGVYPPWESMPEWFETLLSKYGS